MVKFLESLDQAIVLSVNSWNSPFLDEFMWWVSAKITWIPLYLILIYLAYRKIGLKSAVIFLIFVVLTLVLADAISVYALKEVVQRYRPSHNLLIKDSLHLYQISKNDFYSGGLYGFVSSHATNFAVIVSCFCFVLYKEYKTFCYFLFGIVLLVCYSRLYLGVHYLSDILGGIILGILCSYLSFKFIWKKLN
ncbi:MAG: phosphatase PAP2 family protein [Bacteroidota bacterium]